MTNHQTKTNITRDQNGVSSARGVLGVLGIIVSAVLAVVLLTACSSAAAAGSRMEWGFGMGESTLLRLAQARTGEGESADDADASDADGDAGPSDLTPGAANEDGNVEVDAPAVGGATAEDDGQPVDVAASADGPATDDVPVPDAPTADDGGEPDVDDEVTSDETAAQKADEEPKPSTDDVAEDDEEPAAEDQQGEQGDDEEPAAEDGAQATEEAPAASDEDEGAMEDEQKQTTLKATVKSADGSTYKVSVTFGPEAGIPEGAELRVREVNQVPSDYNDEQKRKTTYKNRPLATETFVSAEEMKTRTENMTRALRIGKQDLLLWSKVLDVRLIVDGEEVQPNTKVKVEIENTEIPANVSDALEVAFLDGKDSVSLSCTNATGTKEGESKKNTEDLVSRTAFELSGMGEVSLAQLADQKLIWEAMGRRIVVYGPRAADMQVAETPVFLDYWNGKQLVGMYAFEADMQYQYCDKLWLQATDMEDADQYGGLMGYEVSSDGTSRQVFEPKGASGVVTIDADAILALVWDSGYRLSTVRDGDVTVVGQMPEGATAMASDAAEGLADASALVGEAKPGEELATVAAVDLSMRDGDGGAYAPDVEHPVAVTLSGAAQEPIGPYASYDVVRVEEDGATTPVAFSVDDGDVTFAADTAGTYAVVRRTVVSRTLTASDGKRYEVKVSYDANSGIPNHVALVVNEIAPESAAYDPFVQKTAEILGTDAERLTYARAFDISLIDAFTGEHFQPNENVDVSITLLDQELGDPGDVSVVHFEQTGDSSAEAREIGCTVSGDSVVFQTSGFSVYVVSSYTVDFHWGEYAYSIAGESEIYLSELLKTLAENPSDADAADTDEVDTNEYPVEKLAEIAGDMAQVESVKFSNPELIKVEKKSSEQAENDWLLTSVAPFDTEEALTIRLTNGEEIVVKVTDAAPASYKYYVEPDGNNGSNGESYNTLSDAINSINSRNYNVRLYIGEDCTLDSPVIINSTHNNRTVIIYGNNHTIARGDGATGDLITYDRNSALTIENLTLDGNSVSSSGSLLKKTTNSDISLTGFVAQGHTASSSGICAVDLSAVTGDNNIKVYSAMITGNTSNGSPANLKITGTTAMHIYSSLTQDIGITTDNCNNANQFAYLNNANHTGMEHLTNDLHDQLMATSNGHHVTWTPKPNVDPLDVMFGFPDVTIDDLKVYPTAEDLAKVPEGALPGINNEDPTNPYMIWKSVTYNDDNSTDITLNYYEKQVGMKLDFIFIIDETGTMSTNKSANGYTQSQAVWARMAALEASKGVLQLNIDYASNGTENRVRFISWGGSTVKDSGFINNYSQARVAIDYNVIGGVTDHSVGINAATAASLESRNSNHKPIVIYLSDYQAHFQIGTHHDYITTAEMTALKEASEANYAFLVYETYSNTIAGRMSLLTDRSMHYYMTNRNDPSTLITPFVNIVKDAVARCGKHTSVDDTLANGLIPAAATNTVTSIDLYDTTNDVINSNGIEYWKLVNDANGDNRLYTGVMYAKEIHIPMTDDVYSGAMPTNGDVLVKNEDVEVNRIDASASPLYRKPVTLLLKGNNTSGSPLIGATFTLARDDKTWNLTTDENGRIVLPWGEADTVGATTAESTVAFSTNSVYTLMQITTVDGFVRPAGRWTLTVGDDYKISATTDASPENTNRTRDMAAVEGRFEIYNDSEPTICFDPDGGTMPNGAGADLAVDFDNDELSHTVDLSAYKPNKSNHIFTGWKDESSGTVYGSLMTCYRSDSETINLKAQWLNMADFVARVNNDPIMEGDKIIGWNDSSWTYHAYLINSNKKTGSNEYEGAFNQADSLAGEVIVETLRETAEINGQDRYVLTSGFSFTNANEKTSLTIRTTQDDAWNPEVSGSRFRSTLIKNHNDSMIAVSIGGNLTVENLILFGGGDNTKVNGRGGAINYTPSVLTAELVMTNVDFGALKGSSAAELEAGTKTIAQMSASDVDTNKSFKTNPTSYETTLYYGGGVYAGTKTKIITLTNCKFFGCEAFAGAGIDIDSSSSSSNTPGLVRMITADNCAFIGCTSKYTHGALNEGHDDRQSSGSTEINNCVFNDCGSAMWAAGVLTRSKDMQIKDSVFTNCESKDKTGGAVYMETASGGSLEVDNCRFVNCIAGGTSNDSHGGAIFMTDTDSTNTVTVTGCEFNGCKTNRGSGGAICINTAVKSVTITNSTFEACSATVHGGALYVPAQELNISNTTFGALTSEAATAIRAGTKTKAQLTKDDISADKGCKITTTSNTDSHYGGGVYTGAVCKTVILTNVDFYGCEANGGAGIDIDSSGTSPAGRTITATDCAFIKCISKYRHGALNEGHSSSGHSNRTEIKNCIFTDCSSNKWAAAILTRSNNLKIEDSSFINCSQTGSESAQGGAVYLGNAANGTIELTRCNFTNCTAKGSGGALYMTSKVSTIAIASCTFNTCKADNSSKGEGGALYVQADSLTVSGATSFVDCQAGTNGGAIYASNTVTLTGTGDYTFTGCTAKSKGGGVYAGGTTSFTNVSMDGCSASLGAAVYSAGNLTIKTEDTITITTDPDTGVETTTTTAGTSIIQNCSASDANGGAVSVASGKSMTFEGDVKITGNKGTGSLASQEKNVVLDQNNNTTIRTSAEGLGESAEIGVYVTGTTTTGSQTDPFAQHGNLGDPFGTHDNSTGSHGADNLEAFSNDRVPGLFGVTGPTAGLIYWGQYICKIVDSNPDANTEHAFPTLNKAVNYARKNLSGTATIQMLIDYLIPDGDEVALGSGTVTVSSGDMSYADKITITTAKTESEAEDWERYHFVPTFTAAQGRRAEAVLDADGHEVISKDSEKIAILKRGYSGDSLFTVNAASATLTTTSITFDGGNKNTANASDFTPMTCSGHGGIIKSTVAGSTINLNVDTTLRNSTAAQGGAVCATGTLHVVGADIFDCMATGNGGAICLENGATATESGLVIDGHSTLTFGGDAAANKAAVKGASANANKGGGIYVSANASFTFTGGELIRCKSATDGGGLYNEGAVIMTEKEGVTSLTRGSLEYCHAEGSGGAIFNAAGGTVDMTGGFIEHCVAVERGGGIYTASTATQTVSGKATGAVNLHTEDQRPGLISDCSASNGGGIYLATGELDMAGGTVRNCTAQVKTGSQLTTGNGGGIYNQGTLKLSGTGTGNQMENIDACVAETNGGGIYVDGTGTMDITGGVIEDCRAYNLGGALYDNSKATLHAKGITIKGHTTGGLAPGTTNAAKGGAIYMSDGDLTVEDSFIYDCTATEGGAVYQVYNRTKTGASSTDYRDLLLTNTTIDGHVVLADEVANATNGGAVYISNGVNDSSSSGYTFAGPQLLVEGGSVIQDATASNNGGAIYCDSPAMNSLVVPTVQIKNATINGHESLGDTTWNAGGTGGDNYGGGAVFMQRGTLLVGGSASDAVTIKNCTAATNGGAIFNMPAGEPQGFTVKLSNVTIDGHDGLGEDQRNAGANGGAVFMKMGKLQMVDSTVRACTAVLKGAALYGMTNNGGTSPTKMLVDGGRIAGCTADAEDGGAINVRSGKDVNPSASSPKSSTVSFQNDVVVYDNKDADGNQKNMVLEADTINNNNGVILTTGTGLGASAHVGVYVVGDASTNPYKEHGEYAMPFGTWESDANLSAFTNDRDERLFGTNYAGVLRTQSDKLIYWGRYLCKIVEANHTEHVFPTLNSAIAHSRANANDYVTVGSESICTIQMLMDYAMPSSDLVALEKKTGTGAYTDAIVLTTAPKSTSPDFEGEEYFFVDDGDKATIIRGSGNTSSSMFTVGNSASFTTQKIILDGGAKFDVGALADYEGLTAKEWSNTGIKVAVKGGIVNVASGGAMTVGAGTTMQNSHVYGEASGVGRSGGAIYAEGALAISGDAAVGATSIVFRFCSALGGGAVAIENQDTPVTFSNCSFEYCHSSTKDHDKSAGGAVKTSAKSMTLNTCVFSHCSTVAQGGGFYQGYADNNNLAVSFTATDCSFSHCYAGCPNTTNRAAGAFETQAKTVTITGGTFDNCASTKNAGAINVYRGDNGSDLIITGATFTNCHATTLSGKEGDGGAIRNNGHSTMVTNCSFSNCYAKRGGAVFSNSTTTIGTEGTGTTSVDGCWATKYGGAVYVGSDTFRLTGGTFTNCYAPQGAGVYQGGGNFYFTGGNIDGCVAASTSEAVEDGGTTVSLDSGVANGQGGGVYLEKGNFYMQGSGSGGTISGCKAVQYGGGVYLNGGSFTFTNGSIEHCVAAMGGGVYANTQDADALTIDKSGDAISYCDAKSITASGTTVTVADAPVKDNNGGGIYLANGKPTIDATIRGCNAYNGGGIYISGSGALEMDDDYSVIVGCGATNSGAGVYQNAGTLQIKNGVIKANTAAERGGAVYLNNGTFTIEGGVIGGTGSDKNTAKHGAGIYQGGGTLSMSDGHIYGNVASENGGGIYLGGGAFTITGGLIGVTKANGIVEYADSAAGNSAQNGGGIYVAANANVSIVGGKVSGNRATQLGGGIAPGSENTRLYFAGSIQVFDNYLDPSEDRCDVSLNYDTEKVINTTEPGLNPESHIGVYVTDLKIKRNGKNTTLYQERGIAGKPFGTFVQEKNGKTHEYDSSLNRFINNRSGNKYEHYEYYYGVRLPPEDGVVDPQIYWAKYVCEITDAGEHLLFTNRRATAPALYQYLGRDGAFDALTNNTTFYDKDGNEATPVYVKMLVNTYKLGWESTIEVPARKLIFTMVDKNDGNYSDDKTAYTGYCVIERGDCTTSMFTTAANGDLTMAGITLDGGATEGEDGAWTGGVHADGGHFNAQGKLTLGMEPSAESDDGSSTDPADFPTTDVVLRNSYTTEGGGKKGNGAAIAFSGSGTLTMTPYVTIEHCKAANGGALAVDAAAGTVDVSMESGALISGCQATNGIVYTKSGTLNLNSAMDGRSTGNVRNCTSTNGGLAYVAGGTLNANKKIEHFSGATNGGALYVAGGTLNANANIENCSVPTDAEAYGGAVYVAGGTANLKKTIDTCTAKYGGGVCVKGGTLNLAEDDAKITGCTAEKGGGIFVNGGSANVRFSKGEISHNTATGYGGGGIRIDKDGGSVTVSGTASLLQNKANGTGDQYGGAVSVKKGSLTVSGGTFTSNESKGGSGKVGEGGAIYVSDGATLTMSGGEFVKNTAKTDGACVYVATGGTMNISGAPTFGTGDDANTVTKAAYAGAVNGQQSVYGDDGTARQDIFIEEKHKDAPASLVIKGDLTGDPETIWVWAKEDVHYEQLMPFGVFAEGVEFAAKVNGEVPEGKLDAAHLEVFRNARNDEETDNSTGTALKGTIEGDVPGYVYWTGVAGYQRVILRKVDTDHAPLAGRVFTLYRGTSTTAYKPSGSDDPLSDLSTSDSGCVFSGTLPYGWYILEETSPSPHRYFYLVVDASGVYGTLWDVEGTDEDKVDGYAERSAAETEASARYAALRSAS